MEERSLSQCIRQADKMYMPAMQERAYEAYAMDGTRYAQDLLLRLSTNGRGLRPHAGLRA